MVSINLREFAFPTYHGRGSVVSLYHVSSSGRMVGGEVFGGEGIEVEGS